MTVERREPTDERRSELELLSELRERLSGIVFEGPARLEAIVVSPKHGVHERVAETRVVPGVGVEGDRPMKQWYRGKRMPARQISAMNAEVLDALDIDYAIPGDNLIVRGIDLSRLEKGDALKIGDAVLIATGASHNPCKLFLQRTSTAHYAAIRDDRRRGTMFDALEAATVRVGDPVERIFLDASALNRENGA